MNKKSPAKKIDSLSGNKLSVTRGSALMERAARNQSPKTKKSKAIYTCNLYLIKCWYVVVATNMTK